MLQERLLQVLRLQELSLLVLVLVLVLLLQGPVLPEL